MSRTNAQIIIIAISIITIVSSFFLEETAKQIVLAIGVAIFSTTILYLLNEYLVNESYIRKYFFSFNYFKAKEIRLSLSYLFRIKVDGKYLLVKGKRINQFQPVGGVYKRFHSSYPSFSKWGVKDDNCIDLKDVDQDDLRIRVPRRNLFKVLKWFDSGKDREISHWREFSEELIRTNILTHENFPHINYRIKASHKTKLKYSEHFRCYEILHYDILDLIPTDKQREELKKLQANEEPDKYVWVDEELIKSLGYQKSKGRESFKIGEHSKLII